MTYSAQTNRQQYLSDSVGTASPARLVTMLYDRLALDLLRAEQALAAASGGPGDASSALVHAQDIVTELLAALDVESWSGGPGLAGLYTFLLKELIAANVQRDADRVASCRRLVEPLREAWHEAARSAVGAA